MVIVELKCGHYIKSPRATARGYMDDGAEHCPDCKTVEDVLEEWPEKWHSLCHDCDYHRTHGFSRAYAARSIEQHTRPGHRAYVAWYAPNVPPMALLQIKVRSEKFRKMFVDTGENPPF